MAKFITFRPRKIFIEFRHRQQASVHGGQLAVAALLEQFGLKRRVEAEPALDVRTHKGKGFAPVVYVTQLLHCFTRAGCRWPMPNGLTRMSPPGVSGG